MTIVHALLELKISLSFQISVINMKTCERKIWEELISPGNSTYIKWTWDVHKTSKTWCVQNFNAKSTKYSSPKNLLKKLFLIIYLQRPLLIRLSKLNNSMWKTLIKNIYWMSVWIFSFCLGALWNRCKQLGQY